MAADKDYLRQLAVAIRDEYRKGANTAYRVGSLLLSLIDTDANIESLSQYFIRKNKEDVAQEIITFLKGLVSNLVQSEGFSPGEFGSGFILRNDDGGSYLEIDRLLVRRIAYFVELVIKSLKHVGGTLVLSPASMVCSKVEEYDAYYRCYFEHEREGRFINQEFVPGDQARAQEFNVKEGVNQNVGSRFYWRLVIAVGDNYIDLSKSDAAVGSVPPSAGDDIVQLGNRDDAARSSAIVLSTVGDDAPSLKLYKGICDYSLSGREVIVISPKHNKFTGRFISSTSDKDFDAILDEFGTNLSKIKAQTDQEYTIWFFDHEPTFDNKPAVDWNEDDMIDHEYDLFYNQSEGLAWRFMKGDDGNFYWKPITDQQTIAALEKAAKAQMTADLVTAALNEIVSDGILSSLEKKEVLKEWETIFAEYPNNIASVQKFELVSNELAVAYVASYKELGTYMNGGDEWNETDTPAWLADLSVNQPIDAEEYRGKWMSYYNAERALLNLLSETANDNAGKAQQTADEKIRNFVVQPTPPYKVGDRWSKAVYPASGDDKGSTYDNDDLVCIKSKVAEEEFEITDWEPASALDSKLKKFFYSEFERLDESISLIVGSGQNRDQAIAAAKAAADAANAAAVKAQNTANSASSQATANATAIVQTDKAISLVAAAFEKNDDGSLKLDKNGNPILTKSAGAVITTEMAKLYATSSSVDALSGRVSSAESSITAQADQIALKASQSTVDALSGRVSSAESSITQNAANIELKVSKDGVISSINQSAEKITIKAEKIDLEGKVTFKMLNSDTQNIINEKVTQSDVDSSVKALKNSLKGLAWEDKVELSKLGTTVIEGGYIKTSLIKADEIVAKKLSTSESSDGSVVDIALGRIWMKNGDLVSIQINSSNKQPAIWLTNSSGSTNGINGDGFHHNPVGKGSVSISGGYVSLSSGAAVKGLSVGNISSSFGTDTDFIVGSGTITLPSASTYKGKVIFVKCTSTTTIRSLSPIYKGNEYKPLSKNDDGYYNDSYSARSIIFLSNGTSWFEFTCWYR